MNHNLVLRGNNFRGNIAEKHYYLVNEAPIVKFNEPKCFQVKFLSKLQKKLKTIPSKITYIFVMERSLSKMLTKLFH